MSLAWSMLVEGKQTILFTFYERGLDKNIFEKAGTDKKTYVSYTSGDSGIVQTEVLYL